jgi:hypothetical protein
MNKARSQLHSTMLQNKAPRGKTLFIKTIYDEAAIVDIDNLVLRELFIF